MSSRKTTAQTKVSAEWDAMAGEWDDLASSYRDSFCAALETNILSKKQHQDSISSLTVLDFGCGTGLLAEWLQPRVGRVICVDASNMMVQQCQNKIQASEWTNVEAYCCVLADLPRASAEAQAALEQLEGHVDLIVSSSVLTFVPPEDLKGTMEKLEKLLKPGGILFHSDWPKGEQHTDGFTFEVVKEMYANVGLESESMEIVQFPMGDDKMDVFLGMAKKSS